MLLLPLQKRRLPPGFNAGKVQSEQNKSLLQEHDKNRDVAGQLLVLQKKKYVRDSNTIIH